MSTKRIQSKPAVPALMGLVLVALVWSGCGDQSLTPNQAEYTSENPPPILSSAGSAGVLSTSSSGLSSSEWYTVAEQKLGAGQAAAISGSRYSLRFYEGSTTSDALITIQERDPGSLDVQLGQHGLEFDNPVALGINFAGTNADPDSPNYDGSVPAFYWFNPKTDTWDEMSGYTNDKKWFIVRLTHFSRYALGGKIPGDGTADW